VTIAIVGDLRWHDGARTTARDAAFTFLAARDPATGFPRASELADEALDNADLPGIVKALIRNLPDSLLNRALKTDDVLRRTINGLDLRSLLGGLDDPDEITRQINAAVTKAVKDSLVARLRDLLP